MHSARELKSSSFAIEVGGRSAALEELFEGFGEHDRLGVVLGGISGYVGGKTDSVIQRLIELLMSIPTIPLWMGFAAALVGLVK